MAWDVHNLDGYRTQIKLNPGEAVIGFYQGLAPDAKYDDAVNVRLESLGGDPFSFRGGVTLVDYLSGRDHDFFGKVVCIKKVKKEGKAYVWKFSVWTGELNILMNDPAIQGVIAFTGRKTGNRASQVAKVDLPKWTKEMKSKGQERLASEGV